MGRWIVGYNVLILLPLSFIGLQFAFGFLSFINLVTRDKKKNHAKKACMLTFLRAYGYNCPTLRPLKTFPIDINLVGYKPGRF